MTESYFELIIVRREPDNSVYCDERIRFHSIVEAEYEVKSQASSERGPEEEEYKIYCYIVREIPFGQMCTSDEDCLSERVYLPDGSKMDERLFPSGSISGVYYGRLESQIRAQVGEKVEVLDLAKKEIRTGYVYATPLIVTEIKERYAENPYRLDYSDDSYTILDRPLSECKTDEDYMDAHSHISALRVFRC